MIRKYLLRCSQFSAWPWPSARSFMATSRRRPLHQSPPARAPFASYVAGAGIVEASTENIAVGTPVSGNVTAIYVKWATGWRPTSGPMASRTSTRRHR